LTVALFAVIRAERDEAAKGTSRSIAAKSLQTLDTRQDIDQAIRLAVLAWRVAPTDEALAAVKRVTASSSDVARILGVHTVEQIDALAFRPASAASPELASGGIDGAILFWKIPEGTQASMPLRSNQSRVGDIWFSGDGSHLLSQGSVKNDEDGYDENLVLFDLATGQGRVVARDVSKGQGHLEAERVALSADGKLIAFCMRSEIVVWDADADRMLKKFTGKRVEALGSRFIGTSRLAFVWGLYDYPGALQAGELDLASWSIHLGRPIPASPVDAMNSAVAFSANGASLLLAGFNFGGLAFYRVGDDSTLLPRAMPAAAQQKNDIRFHIVFDAKGERVIVGGGNKILAWDTVGSGVLKEVRVPISTDVPVAISPDGRWAASVDHAKIVLWDLAHAGVQVPGQTLNASCSVDGDAARACVRMLCEKVSKSLDEKGIVRLLGLADARNLRADLLKSPCP
jgi:WD40 repeat protein